MPKLVIYNYTCGSGNRNNKIVLHILACARARACKMIEFQEVKTMKRKYLV